MAAQGHLHERGEPADRIVIALWNEESRLRKVVLGRDGLKGVVVQPLLQGADRGWVTREDGRGERI